MKRLMKEILLANGLTLRFTDATRRYFGDYHKVTVEISCEVPLTPDLFEDESLHAEAVRLLGPSVIYLKREEHQGVPTAEVSAVVDRLVEHFLSHTVRYLEGESFPRRLVRSELDKLRKRSSAFVPLRAHV